MNKKLSVVSIALCILLIMLCIPALAEDASATKSASPDFKQFYWGDSKETIMEIEGEPYLDGKVNGINATYIAYETTAVGLDMLLAYYFCDDGLFRVRYVLAEEHSNDSLYIDDYKTFRNAMTKKYGEPTLDQEIWENDSKKEYYADKKGDALCYGYLEYVTFYYSDTSIIMMNMSADNYDITMSVDYESLTISPGEADYSNEV